MLLSASVASARKPHGVSVLLDRLHEAASKADGAAYFDCFTPSGIFVGTDATEVWTIDQFKAYALPIFAKGKGWTYHPDKTTRRIMPVAKDGQAFRFYETLKHAKYGTLRGSGVAVFFRGKLLVDQYVLSFAIPNEKTDAMLKAVAD